MKPSVLFILIMINILQSCTRKKYLPEKELYEYIQNESNGLSREIDNHGVKARLTWKSPSIIAFHQMNKGTAEEYDSLKTYFSKRLYFTWELSYDGKDIETYFAAAPNFDRKIFYLGTGIQHDVFLIAASDTLPALACSYSRSYGMGPTNCLFAFDYPKTNHFSIELKPYPLGIAKQKFHFSIVDIKNAPELKY